MVIAGMFEARQDDGEGGQASGAISDPFQLHPSDLG